MAKVVGSERDEFFRAVDEASRRAVWAALASVEAGEPRVRMIHPTWEAGVLWFATGTRSPKLRQLRANPAVEIQYQVAPPDFVHIVVRGRAEIVELASEKKRVWDVIDYDLEQFWTGGPTDPEYSLVKVHPRRVELSKMFGSQDVRVWSAGEA